MGNKSSKSNMAVPTENKAKSKTRRGSLRNFHVSDGTCPPLRDYGETDFCEFCWKMVDCWPLTISQKTPWVRALPMLDEEYKCQLCRFLVDMIKEAREKNLSKIPKDWSKFPYPTPEELRGMREALKDPDFCWEPFVRLHVYLESTSEQVRMQEQAGIKPVYGARKWHDLNTVTFEWKDKYSVSDGNFKYFTEYRGPFRFRAEPGQPAAKWITNRKLSADFGSETNFNQVKDWVNNCQTQHPLCNKRKGPLPTRVLQVGRINDRYIRLYITEREAKNYLALSYCWGGKQEIILTKATIKDMKCQMLVSTLPQTIQDAITVTRKLGEKYLWIDSLCIIQDSETDKLQEIGRMDEVYKNAFLTISAASGKGCHDGFLGRRNMAEEIPFPYECPDDTFSGILSSGFIQEVSHSVAREPIDFRAWTMQESMLAQRLLCYGCEQISWICPNRLETFDSPLPPLRYGVAPLFIPEQLMLKEHGPASVAAAQNIVQQFMGEEDISGGLDWMMIVEDYTSRQLSYQTDKLSAISSLAKQWSGTFRKEDGPYVAGLFLNKITSHLMWFAQKEAPRPVVPPYVAPTWSWASIDGPVTYRGYKKLHGTPIVNPSKNFFEVLECSTTPVLKSFPMGSISGAVLKVRGAIRQVGEFAGREMDSSVLICMDENPAARFGSKVWWLRVYTDLESEDLHRTEGLILKHLHGSMYSRIGAFFEIDRPLRRSRAFGENFRGSFMTGVFKDVPLSVIYLV